MVIVGTEQGAHGGDVMGRKGEAGGGKHEMCSFDGCCRGFGEVLGGNELR